MKSRHEKQSKGSHRYWSGLVYLYALFFISIPILIADDVSANSLGINLYGISYHFLNHTQSRDRLNELNPGLGLRASFWTDSTNILFLEGGAFKDTFENKAKYISLGYLIRFWNQLRIGLNAAIYCTKSTNRGRAFFAPIPLASYTTGPLTMNVTFLPKYRGVNPYNIIGVYATIRLYQGKS